MNNIVVRLIAVSLTALSIAACSTAAAPSGPAGQPSTGDVNPVTGSRGGTNGGGAAR